MDGPLPILYKLIGLTLDSNSQIYFTRYTLFMYLVSLINRILFYISHQSCKLAYNKSYQQNCRSSLQIHQTIYSQDADQSSHIHKIMTCQKVPHACDVHFIKNDYSLQQKCCHSFLQNLCRIFLLISPIENKIDILIQPLRNNAGIQFDNTTITKVPQTNI